MAVSSRVTMLTILLVVAFGVSGCQSTGKWATAWNDRSKPKSEFKDPNETEQVSYWPYRSVKNKQKMSPVPSQLQAKATEKAEQSKRETQLKELLNEGDQLRKNGQLEDARLVYQKAMAISSDNADIHRRLAIVADLQGKFNVADEHYAETLRLRPRDIDVLSDKGYSFVLRGNPQQAEMVLREALLIEPSHKRAMANLAAIYAKQNRYPEALAMFRAGCTEAEAQQNVAKFFPQSQNLAMVSGTQDPAQAKVNPAVASSVTENPPDLKNFTFDQIQAEMARRKQEARQRRSEADQRELEQYRSLSAAEEAEAQQAIAQAGAAQGTFRGNAGAGTRGRENPALNNQQFADTLQRQGVTLQPGLGGQSQEFAPPGNASSMNPRFQPPDRSIAGAAASNRDAEIFRGTASSSQPGRQGDLSAQRGWSQQGSGPANRNQQPVANNFPQNNDLTATQMVTQLGMTAGPGSLFPAPQPTAGMGYPSNPMDTRMGSEFSPDAALQNPANQSPQGWPRNQNDQRRGATANSNDEGLTIGPPSPASNWGPPSMTSGANWQNNSPESSAWSNELQSGTGPSTALDQPGFQSAWGRNDTRRSADGFDNPSPGVNPSNRYRTANDGARPYNGTWPNSNSLPPRQNQAAPNTSRFDSFDQLSNGPINNAGGANPGEQNGSFGNGAVNSLPLWPSAPNR